MRDVPTAVAADVSRLQLLPRRHNERIDPALRDCYDWNSSPDGLWLRDNLTARLVKVTGRRARLPAPLAMADGGRNADGGMKKAERNSRKTHFAGVRSAEHRLGLRGKFLSRAETAPGAPVLQRFQDVFVFQPVQASFTILPSAFFICLSHPTHRGGRRREN